MADRFFLNIGTDWNDTANWSLSSGGSGGASVPGSTDIATFDTNSGDCDMNTAVNVSGILLDATYGGTVKQDAGNIIDVGTGDFVVDGGIFLGGDSNITCIDRFIVGVGGLFTSTSATLQVTNTVSVASSTYTHNNGLFKYVNSLSTSFSWNGNSFYDFEFAVSASTVTTFSGNMIVLNTFTATHLGSSHSGSGDFECRGNIITNSPTNATGHRPVKINGTGVQSITAPITGYGGLGPLHFQNTISTISVSNDIGCGGDLTIDAGVITDFTTTSSTISLSGSATTITTNGATLYNLRFNNSNISATNIGTTLLQGSLNLDTLSTCNGGVFEIKKDYITSDSSLSGSSLVLFSGTGNQVWSGTGDWLDGNITINKTSGSVTLGTNVSISSLTQDVTLVSGTLNLGIYNLTLNNLYTQNGGNVVSTTGIFTADIFSLQSGVFDPIKAISNTTQNTTLFYNSVSCSLMPSGGIFEFRGSNHWTISQSSSTEFPRLVINKCTSCTQAGTWYAKDVELKNDTKWGSGFIRGNLTSSGYSSASGTQVFDGSLDQTISGNITFYKLKFNKSAGITTFNDSIRVSECEAVQVGDGVDFSTNEVLVDISNANVHLPSSNWKVSLLSFYNLRLAISATGDASMPSTTVLNNLTISRCRTLDNSYFTVGGNVISTDTSYTSIGTTLLFNGGEEQTISLAGSVTGLQNSIIVDKSGGKVAQLSGVGHSALNLTITKGIWCTNNFALSVDNLIINTDIGILQKTAETDLLYNTLSGIITNVIICAIPSPTSSMTWGEILYKIRQRINEPTEGFFTDEELMCYWNQVQLFFARETSFYKVESLFFINTTQLEPFEYFAKLPADFLGLIGVGLQPKGGTDIQWLQRTNLAGRSQQGFAKQQAYYLKDRETLYLKVPVDPLALNLLVKYYKAPIPFIDPEDLDEFGDVYDEYIEDVIIGVVAECQLKRLDFESYQFIKREYESRIKLARKNEGRRQGATQIQVIK